MANHKIKNILFDMGGILFIQDTQEAIRRFSSFGIDTDKYMGKYGQKDFFLDLEDGLIDCKEFCRRMTLATGRGHISEEEASYCWLGYIDKVPVERLKALEELREDYRLGLASNTNPFVMNYMDSPAISPEGRGISSYFDWLFTSYTMGGCKPSREYFEKAIAMGNLIPEETLFVDDSIKNVEGARACGIHGLHIEHNVDWRPSLHAYLA